MADEDEEMNVDQEPADGRGEDDENDEGAREEITAEEVRRAIRAGQFVSPFLLIFLASLLLEP